MTIRRVSRMTPTRRSKPRIEDTSFRMCMTPGCGWEKIHAKGLCWTCYMDCLKKIKARDTFMGGPYDGMKITWDRLEATGKCRQQRKHWRKSWM